MKLFLLGGNSYSNKPWVKDFRQALKKISSDVFAKEYRHWQNGEKVIDLEYEIEQFKQDISNEDNYVVVAKSLGSIVAARGASEMNSHPRMIVVVGAPLSIVIEERFTYIEWLNNIPCPKLFMQNDHDPLGSFSDLEQYFSNEKLANYKALMLKGNTHHYDDIKLMVEHIGAALSTD